MGKSKIRRNVELMGLSKKVKNRVLRKVRGQTTHTTPYVTDLPN